MRGTKRINWGTPKEIQRLKTRDGEHYKYGGAKKTKVCKILKGPHIFDREETISLGGKPWMIQYHCVCGKKGSYKFLDK